MWKTCRRGHQFFKTSDCPTCPKCEALLRPKDGFLQKLAAPARRALEKEGITSLTVLSRWSENDLLALHGFGPSSLPVLREQLRRAGKKFKK